MRVVSGSLIHLIKFLRYQFEACIFKRMVIIYKVNDKICYMVFAILAITVF